MTGETGVNGFIELSFPHQTSQLVRSLWLLIYLAPLSCTKGWGSSQLSKAHKSPQAARRILRGGMKEVGETTFNFFDEPIHSLLV